MSQQTRQEIINQRIMAGFKEGVEITPVSSLLIQLLGNSASAVWGCVWWKYAREEGDVCKASPERIGKHLNMDAHIVQRHLKTLVDNDFLKIITSNLGDAPRKYAITDKARKLLIDPIISDELIIDEDEFDKDELKRLQEALKTINE